MFDLMDPFAIPATGKILVCPGCERWQLDYTFEVAIQWAKVSVRTPASMREGLISNVDLTAFDDMVEAILREHVAQECPHPRLILEMLKGGGKLAL